MVNIMLNIIIGLMEIQKTITAAVAIVAVLTVAEEIDNRQSPKTDKQETESTFQHYLNQHELQDVLYSVPR